MRMAWIRLTACAGLSFVNVPSTDTQLVRKQQSHQALVLDNKGDGRRAAGTHAGFQFCLFAGADLGSFCVLIACMQTGDTWSTSWL